MEIETRWLGLGLGLGLGFLLLVVVTTGNMVAMHDMSFSVSTFSLPFQEINFLQ